MAPSLPKPRSCSSQHLQDAGGGRGWWDHVPLSIHLWVCRRVGEGRVPGQPVTPHCSPSPSRASTPSPQLRMITPILTGCLMQGIPQPHSLPPLQEAIPSLNWKQSILTLWELGSTLIFLESPQSTCPSPRRQLQMSPCAFPLPFPPPHCF